jgi:uncharacterized protein (TIGR02453 family)
MPPAAPFTGFNKATSDFFVQLTLNNNKAWFDEHRRQYEEDVLAPARAFIIALGEELIKFCPMINAIPAVNKSLFRINRDTRFSKDKTPYKTHLGIWLWEGQVPRMECPGFYFHLEPPHLMLGGGLHIFAKHHLAAFRDLAIDKTWGPELSALVKQLADDGLEIGGRHYKRVPRGYDKEHPNAKLLLHKGLSAMHKDLIPAQFDSGALVDYCMAVYQKMLPMHKWLLELVKRA